MHIPIEPYLSLVRREISTSLMPEDDNARRIATYLSRMLNQLIVRTNTLPALEMEAIGALDGLLDELNAHLRAIPGAMVLTGDLVRHVRTKPDYVMLEPLLQRVVRVLLDYPSPTSKALVQRILIVLCNMEAGFDAATRAGEVLPQAKGDEIPPLDRNQRHSLQSYLRKTFAETTLELGRIKAITGGGSKKTLIITLLHTQNLPGTIVLRADQVGGVVESSVVDEYKLIEIVYAAGLPVPRPFVAETDKSIIGAPFILVGHLEGVNNGDHITIYEPTRAFATDLAQAMGKLHAIPPERFGDKIPGAKLSTQEYLKQEMQTFERIWRSSDQPSPVFEMGYAWLKDHLQFVDGPRSLNHGDIACHNILAMDGRLTALLDWETTSISSPAHDLAYVYALVIQMMSWEDFLTEYEKAGGKRPSPSEFDFFRLWTQLWRATFQFIARSFFHSGIAESVVLAYGTQHLWQRINHDLHMLVKQLYETY